MKSTKKEQKNKHLSKKQKRNPDLPTQSFGGMLQ